MENATLMNKISSNLEINKLKESGGLFGMFTTGGKKELIDACIYKSDLFIALSDSTIILYDMIREFQKIEITEIANQGKTIVQLAILHQIDKMIDQDMIICLCEKQIYFFDTENYQICLMQELGVVSQKMYIDFIETKKAFIILTVNKYSISVYEIIRFQNQKNSGLTLSKIYEIDRIEQITNKNILYHTKFFIFETKNRIYFHQINYQIVLRSKSFYISKKDNPILKSELTPNEISQLSVLLQSSSSKTVDGSKDIQFNYSAVTSVIYLTIHKKILIIKNCYEDHFIEEFEVIEKITKPSIILFSKVIDPYFFICTENKISVFFILDLNKCIEMIEMDYPASSINFCLYILKDLAFLYQINKLSLESNVIQYTDILHLERLKFRTQFEKDYILNSCQICLLFYIPKSFKFQWIFSVSIDEQCRFLRGYNVNFTSKLLALYKNDENISFLSTYKQLQLHQSNQKFLLIHTLELFYNLISIQDYPNAKICQNEAQVDNIFLYLLLRNFISSQSLLWVIEYLYKLNLGKYVTSYESDDTQIDQDYHSSIITKQMQELVESQYEAIANMITNSELKLEKDLPAFLKAFFNKLISNRNEMKIRLDKEDRKRIKFDHIIDTMTKVIEGNNTTGNIFIFDERFQNIKDFESLHRIQSALAFENIKEDEIKYCLIENIVFILHYYSYKLSKNTKYTDNLKLIIKTSYNLLDKNLLSLLSELRLEEEILLFYYYRGNYVKCINNIVTIYESLDKGDYDSSFTEENYTVTMTKSELGSEERSFEKESIDNDFPFNSGKNEVIDKKNYERIKIQWLVRYISLISLISDKISPVELYEYIKWALAKNPFKTIDILMENNKLSKEKLDMEFINLLKTYGIDPVIYYLKKFVHQEGNSIHTNEMINLYTIKIKLLLEAKEKKVASDSMGMDIQYYKWNKKIMKTREDFWKFLIWNNSYDMDIAYDKILLVPYCQMELGIVLIKQNKFEEGIPKIFSYDYPIKVVKTILESMPYFDLIYLFLKHIILNYRQLNLAGSVSEEEATDNSLESIIISIINIIKKETSLLLQLFRTNLFDELKSARFLDYFIRILSNIDSMDKNLKIEASLLDSKIISAYNSLYNLQAEHVMIDSNLICRECKQGFMTQEYSIGQVIYVYPSSYYHLECYNKFTSPNE